MKGAESADHHRKHYCDSLLCTAAWRPHSLPSRYPSLPQHPFLLLTLAAGVTAEALLKGAKRNVFKIKPDTLIRNPVSTHTATEDRPHCH